MEPILPNIPPLMKIENLDKITEVSLSLLFKRAEMLNETRYSLLKPENFGIVKLIIDQNALRSRVFKINEIECILSNGTEYYHKANTNYNHSINLESLELQESEGAYIYITISDYLSEEVNKINFDRLSQIMIKEHLNSGLNIITNNKNAALVVGKNPPLHCAYLPIAKLKLSKIGIELDDFIPPMINIKSNQNMIGKLENSLDFLNAKFLMVKKDIDNNKKELNAKRYHENYVKMKHLNNAIDLIRQLLKQDLILPTELYLKMNKILANISSLNLNIPLPKIEPYDHFTFGFHFNNILKVMNEIVNQEISEKYKLYLFTKKEDFYYLKLPKQNSLLYKIALKKPHRVSPSQLVDWMNTSLICEKAEYHSMIEKRSLGYERKNEYADIETNLKNDYVFFSVKLSSNQNLSENTLIISQSNSKFSLYEPDEIALYWEMNEIV